MDPATAVAAAVAVYQGAQQMGLFGDKYSAAQAAYDQYNYNLKLQQQAQGWNEYMYKNRYQFQVDDLKKAGINPMYGLGSAPSVSSGTNSIGMPEYVQEAAQKEQKRQNFINNGMNILTFLRDYSAVNAENKLKTAQTNTENYNTQLKALETIGTQLNNLYKQKELNTYDKRFITELREAQSRITSNLGMATQANANAMSARETASFMQQKTKTEIEATKAAGEAVKKARRENKWHEEHPVLSEMGLTGDNLYNSSKILNDTVGNIIKALGNNGSQRKYKR